MQHKHATKPKNHKKAPESPGYIYLLASRRSRPLLQFVVVYHDHLRFLFAKILMATSGALTGSRPEVDCYNCKHLFAATSSQSIILSLFSSA